MILYAITEVMKKYRTNSYTRQKLALEKASGDVCLVAHYTQVTPRRLAEWRPWAICHSGASTPYETYGILRRAAYTRAILESAVPQLGLCGGHQLLAELFGGRTGPMRRLRAGDPDLNARYHPGDYKEWGVYPVRIVRRDPLFRGLGKVVRVQEFHRSEIKKLGPELVRLAETADCRVQAFVHRARPIWGVQFHPEEAGAAYPDGARILRNFFDMARARRGG